MVSSQSTYTLQNAYDDLRARGDLNPGWDNAGFTVRPIIAAANRTFEQICGGEGSFPWKWNQFNLPQFVWNSWQQDYALINPNGTSVTSLAWLSDGMAIDINNPNMPKPYAWVQVGRNQGRMTGSYISNSIFRQPLCTATWLFNNQMYFGTWGAAAFGNNTWGNNPQANQVITSPYGSNMSMPSNPITQVIDSNGNYLVLTTYGTTGASAPSAAINAAPGTTVADGSCVWTVVDPWGAGIRIAPVPSQTGTVWQMNLVGQLKPTVFVGSASLASQTLFPLPNQWYPRFLDGCAAELLLYSADAKKKASYPQANAIWMQSINAMRGGSDRERELNRIRPKRSILGAGGGRSGNAGPFWPYNYPIT